MISFTTLLCALCHQYHCAIIPLSLVIDGSSSGSNAEKIVYMREIGKLWRLLII
jgi:hypothetical protein